MTATAARVFTALITSASNPREPFPTPQGAVRLAYYVREQAHDLRVRLGPKSKQIWCFVARGRRRSDAVYWVQNLETGYVLKIEYMQEAINASSRRLEWTVARSGVLCVDPS